MNLALSGATAPLAKSSWAKDEITNEDLCVVGGRSEFDRLFRKGVGITVRRDTHALPNYHGNQSKDDGHQLSVAHDRHLHPHAACFGFLGSMFHTSKPRGNGCFSATFTS